MTFTDTYYVINGYKNEIILRQKGEHLGASNRKDTSKGCK